MGPLAVTAGVLRPGRSVQLVGAELYDVARERVVASARAWLFPMSGDVRAQPAPPRAGRRGPPRRPTGWHGGYLDAVEWRWISGSVVEPGPSGLDAPAGAGRG